MASSKKTLKDHVKGYTLTNIYVYDKLTHRQMSMRGGENGNKRYDTDM